MCNYNTSSIPYLVIDILDITDMHVLDISDMCDGGDARCDPTWHISAVFSSPDRLQQ